MSSLIGRIPNILARLARRPCVILVIWRLAHTTGTVGLCLVSATSGCMQKLKFFSAFFAEKLIASIFGKSSRLAEEIPYKSTFAG